MITLSTNRQDLEIIRKHFFPFIEMLRETKLNNVAHASVQSEEYINCLAINCIIDEVMEVVNKKLDNTAAQQFKIKFSDAQALICYRVFISLSIPSSEFYFNKLRNQWVEMLDIELINNAIYQQAVHKPDKDDENEYIDFEEY